MSGAVYLSFRRQLLYHRNSDLSYHSYPQHTDEKIEEERNQNEERGRELSPGVGPRAPESAGGHQPPESVAADQPEEQTVKCFCKGKGLSVLFQSFMQSLLSEEREEGSLFPVQLGGAHMRMRGGVEGTKEPLGVTAGL